MRTIFFLDRINQEEVKASAFHRYMSIGIPRGENPVLQYASRKEFRAKRAFSAGFDAAAHLSQRNLDALEVAFKKWHMTLMPKKYHAVRYEKDENGQLTNEGVRLAYMAYRAGYNAGMIFYEVYGR